MTSPPEASGSSRSARPRHRRNGWTLRLTPSGVMLLVAINLVILGGLAYGISRMLDWSTLQAQLITLSPTSTFSIETTTTPLTTITPSHIPSGSPTPQPAASRTPQPPSPSPHPLTTLTLNQGLIILAMDEGGNTHLFAYQPEETGAGQPLPLTRLTYGPWDDITPAISPDGQTVAFASNRNGYWDLYLLNLGSGVVDRLTDTLAYEAAPSWSPDGEWLVYEAYVDENLEIRIQSVTTPGDPILLTNNPAADHSPVWSPQGRQIAFVSNRSGENEIWLADLDKSEDQRFLNISQSPESKDTHPAWSPDGTALVWAGEQDGFRSLFFQTIAPEGDSSTPSAALNRRNLGSGDWPVWSADGETVLTALQAPNRTYLTAYPTHIPGLVLPPLELPGSIMGLSWGKVALAWPLLEPYRQAAELTPTPLFFPALTALPDENGGRYQLSQLEDIEAPNPYLHDLTDESFLALRSSIAAEAGWDFLSTLENAYVPLTSPLGPGMGDDWLYTGRAFAINTLPINAGWLVAVREDIGAETYWRVYIRARYQDGSAGIPLHDQPWDFNARYGGDPTAYEQGGVLLNSIPPGYWIDFTQRALSYGWNRLPALPTWRASYPATRFNEFASTGGMDWRSAMLELYPPEVLITPSPVVPPTRTLTPTPRWYVSPTPTPTSTPRPTFTPISPTYLPTLTPTVTPTRTSTPRATPTRITPSATSTGTPVTPTPIPTASSTAVP
jgi:TolB protein